MFLFEKPFYGFFFLLLSVQMLSWSLLHGNSCAASSFDDLSQQTPFLSITRQVTSQDVPPTLQRTDSSSLTAHPKHTYLQTVLWAVALPLDLLKKASLCVLKSSWLFVATTGAPLPNANALFANGITRHTLYAFGITDKWDVNTCKGRALNANDTQSIHDKTHDYRNYFCMQRASYLCNKLGLAESEDHKHMFEKLCDTSMCAPRVVLRSSQRYIQGSINSSIAKECQQLQ